MPSSIRVLLVDDNSYFLDSAARFLKDSGLVNIVGRASSGDEAVREASRLKPDLVVIDIAMPGINGLEATQIIKSGPQAPLVVITTMHDHPEVRTAATRVQADAFIAKPQFCTHINALIASLWQPLQPQEAA